MQALLDGTTRVSVIIGMPIVQVRSPEGITREMRARGYNGVLVPLEVAPGDVASVIAALGTVSNLDGITVTVPHKQAAFACCEDVSERSRFLGAVNVMRRRGAQGGFAGDHVDGESMLRALQRVPFDVRGRAGLLIGAGGAGSAIALSLLEAGINRLVIAEADRARLEDLVGRLDARFSGRVMAGDADPRGFDLVVNATPVGMRPGDASPIDTALLVASTVVADVVTPPGVSALVAGARAAGCPTVTGQQMFDAGVGLLTDFLIGAPAVA